MKKKLINLYKKIFNIKIEDFYFIKIKDKFIEPKLDLRIYDVKTMVCISSSIGRSVAFMISLEMNQSGKTAKQIHEEMEFIGKNRNKIKIKIIKKVRNEVKLIPPNLN